MDFEKDLRATETGIPGLVVLDLSVHGDARGWFKENWQRAKMVAAGLPAEFRPVQNNVSFNAERGRHARHPRRALEQVHLGRRGLGLWRVG